MPLNRPDRPSQLWASAPLDEPQDGWLLVLGFVVDRGMTELRCMTLCPHDPDLVDYDHDHLLGEIARSLADQAEQATAARLTSRVIRSAALSELEREARAFASTASSIGWGLERGAAGDAVRKPRGRRGSGDLRLARFAARYVELCAQEDRPVAALAAETGYPANTISGYLHRARFRGLLNSAGKGKAGGSLTDRARQLLEES